MSYVLHRLTSHDLETLHRAHHIVGTVSTRNPFSLRNHLHSIALPGVAADFEILNRGFVGVSVSATSAGWSLSCVPVRPVNESKGGCACTPYSVG